MHVGDAPHAEESEKTLQPFSSQVPLTLEMPNTFEFQMQPRAVDAGAPHATLFVLDEHEFGGWREHTELS